MLGSLSWLILYVFLGFSPLALAQLSGKVGPTTTRDSKKSSVCNILKYGAAASKISDIGPALVSAFNACKNGGIVYIPPGEYGMSTWVSLSGGQDWALQLDGIIYRTGSQSGNMIYIEKSRNFELYSNSSEGAVQGNGYEFHRNGKYGARLLRLSHVQDFSVHDIALVDAPQFHLFLDQCTNGEVYNMIIRGGNEGGLDGIDVSGSNIWVHDVEVSNRDECVTVKNPSDHLLIEGIYCNWSGGRAIGSLGADTDIHHVTYDKIYTSNGNQMLMIKSNGGSGSVRQCTFSNFTGQHNAYTLNVDAHWSELKQQPGNGVLYTDLKFRHWRGSCADGSRRAPIQVFCPDAAPCHDIVVEDFAMWTETGSRELYKCGSAFEAGGCLRQGTPSSYVVSTVTVAATLAGWNNMPTMAADLTMLPLTESIPIPAIPTTFYPGATPYSKLLGA
ncbi:Rhamnogalacturonase A [Pleurostoma richardsiae]|uniref:Rhamnogalacturonase A n=1 Tax=Pleurostoma richardsiae TaxID=41990 RepID=A0AA38RNE6_9PEZI|nr:Rhamnogalacturonase A [Pleurostoma richardsiae]